MAQQRIPYRCPQCGRIHDYPVYEGVDVSKEPQFRAKVMDASIFDFVCPHCGSVNGVLYPFLYHDPTRRFMVQLVDHTVTGDPFVEVFNTDSETDQALRQVVQDMKSRYRLRTVTTPNELMEKIAVFEADLDDHVLEIMKYGIIASDEKNTIDHLWFAPTDSGPVFLAEENGEFTRSIPLDEKVYNMISDSSSFESDPETRIDEAWAKRQVSPAS